MKRFVIVVVVLIACLGLAPSAAFADLINGLEDINRLEDAVLGMSSKLPATGTTKNILTLSGTTMNLSGNVNPADVVWNLNGASGANQDITISSSATAIGTFLAPNQHILVDNATVEGEVIGGGNGAQLSIHSSSKVTAPEIPTVIPEPMSMILLGTGLVGFVGVTRRKLRKPRF